MTLRQTLLAAALAITCGAASAVTLRVANQGDSNSMDPHSLNESLQLSFTGNVYEPLVGRDKKLALTPALATSWKQTSPTGGASSCARGCSSTAARSSRPTTCCSRSSAPPATAPT